MIEVESRFAPTDEQLKKLLADCEFVGEVNNHDIYYDYPDFRLLKTDARLRLRNGEFELKLKREVGGDVGNMKSDEEIQREEEIKSYFNTEKSIADLVANEMEPFMDYTTKRKKYKKGDFAIDVDELDFGYKLVEIELMIASVDKIKEAEGKINSFAKQYDFSTEKLPSKREMYFKIVRPDLYKMFYE